MRTSALLAPTLRENPAEAEVPSHSLMLRAGLIRKAAAGMYTFLPLGLRALQKVSAIIRQEMNRAGGQELLLPIVQPAELWERTGRWEEYGEEMFRLADRHGRRFCLGPTHEEIITALVAAEVRSYRDLPLLLYQLQNKYRDEIRPRFGVMRGREFIMKDLYSFDRDEAGLEESYKKMYEAYRRAFARMGLDVRAVEADPGAIGGSTTHEFMVLAGVGEAEVVHCPACRYAANVEKAESPPPPAPPAAAQEELRAVATPGVRGVDELSAFLGTGPDRILKTLIYRTPAGLVAAVLRGDHELNEVKLARALGVPRVEPAGPEEVERATGSPPGFAGPVGLGGPTIVADPWAVAAGAAVTGANRPDTHYAGVHVDRDWRPHKVADIRRAAPGDPCPRCGGKLAGARGVEVGQIFRLGTKYSQVLGATYLDAEGRSRPIVMGCYGIGVTRSLAAIIEQHHDERGIVWPVSVAPFEVVIVPVRYEDPGQGTLADRLYGELVAAGVEVLLDDRAERAGVKFNDADLQGIPLRITVGPRGAAAGRVELRLRRDGTERELAAAQVTAAVQRTLEQERRALDPDRTGSA